MSGARRLSLFLIGLAVGLPLSALAWRWQDRHSGVIEVHGRMAEEGGWTPDTLRTSVGVPLRLRLTSDDVVHGFAVGRRGDPPVDVMPGQTTEVELTFEMPGTYTFYCTRWCGAGHWRMRGTIEVGGGTPPAASIKPPLYARLGIDIDAPHLAEPLPEVRPSAARGADVERRLQGAMPALDLLATSPAEAFLALRASVVLAGRSDAEVWDVVASLYRQETTAPALTQGAELYAANCAACHGEGGAGDGVMAESLQAAAVQPGHANSPADFTDPQTALGASPALLHGKILRGGMGTGMPYFGPILRDDEIWSLVGYLWTFHFDFGDEP